MMARALGTLLALSLAACSGEATQLIVVVETNLDVPAEIDEVAIVVTGPSAVSSSTNQPLVADGDPAFPLTLTVLPAGVGLGPVTVVARGLLGGLEEIRAEVSTTLIEGEARMVRLFLLRSCIDRDCEGMTCGENGCTPIDVDGQDLPRWTGEPPPFDGTDPCLSTPWDQDGDGQGADACGGDDCDDLEPRSFLGNVEECDEIDNDCDGGADEDCSCGPEGVVGACPTVCGSMGTRMCAGGIWTSCVTDEVCNGVDVDCDGRTDEGFAYVAAAPRQITTSRNQSGEPDLIFANGRYDILWVEDDDSGSEEGFEDHEVYFISLDENGDPGSGTPVRVAREARAPSLAFNGSRFGAAWWGECGRNCEAVFFATLDQDGNPASAPVDVERGARQSPTPRVVWTGSDFGVGYFDNETFLRRVDDTGNLMGPRTVVAGRGGGLDMLYTGSAFAFLISNNNQVLFNVGTPAAFLMPSAVVHSAGGQILDVALVETDIGYFAAWEGNDGRLVETAVLDDSGALLGMVTPREVPMMRPSSGPHPAVAAIPGQVILVFRSEDNRGDQDLYFARFAEDGTELQAPTQIPAPMDQFDPSIAWSADHLGVAYVDDSSFDDQIYFNTIGCP